MSGFNLWQEMVIVTVIGQECLPDNLLGQKKIFSRSGTTGKLRFPWLEDKAAELARLCLANGSFEVTTISNPAQKEQAATIMIDPYLPPPELIILGGGHIAVPLVTIGRLLGYQVAVVDDRPDFVSSRRFPEADRVIYCNFFDIEDRLTLGPRSSVVIVTRGHKHDLDCLRQLIKYPLAYLGMIGSRRRVRMVRSQLIEEGFDAHKVDMAHMPIGLDIGAQTPGEIAVSIAAELIQVRRGGKSHFLKASCSDVVSAANVYEMPSAADLETFQKAIEAASKGIPAAVATIVKTGGSTPRKAGARMLVYRDGRAFGTIGGGFGEAEARVEALNVIEEGTPRFYELSMNADLAAMEGMACGGMMKVFIEPVSKLTRIFDGGETIDPN